MFKCAITENFESNKIEYLLIILTVPSWYRKYHNCLELVVIMYVILRV